MNQDNPDSRVGIVMITWNRREQVLDTLQRLAQLPERPAIVLVDNGSSDGTTDSVVERFPGVQILALERNMGAVGRTLGVQALNRQYIAFCDDDTWWDAGDLRRAADLFDAHTRLGLIMARVLVGPQEQIDPTCIEIEQNPLPPRAEMPGLRLLGFLAGASMVRRSAFLEAGGFSEAIRLGGEEEWLAVELASRSWWLCYVAGLTVHHYPCPHRDSDRNWRLLRNALWFAWLRRPFLSALRRTFALICRQPWSWSAAKGLFAAILGLPRLLPLRRVVPSEIEKDLRQLETFRDGSLPTHLVEDHDALQPRLDWTGSAVGDTLSNL